MEDTIDAMAKTYEDFVAAIAGVVRASAASGGLQTAADDSALEDFARKWDLFKASCDRAEEVIDDARKRIAPEHALDMACEKPAPAREWPVISVPRLETALQAVQSLAADHQKKPEPPEEAKPSEEAKPAAADADGAAVSSPSLSSGSGAPPTKRT